MYTTIQSFLEEYQNESLATQKLLNLLTDESLKQEVAPGFRTLGHLAWHLVPFGGLLATAGLTIEGEGFTEGSEPPTSASVIADSYSKAVVSLLEAVRSQWTDEWLMESCDMWGEQWKYGLTLSLFVRHEVHHRGQLTILMRQAGLPIIGVYGPTKEEWAHTGLEAPM